MKIHPIAQHDGADRPRGAVGDRELVFSPYTRHGSRRFNPVEYAAHTVALQNELEEAIADACEAASAKFLSFYRELLAPYRITNHRVTISAGMGMATIDVADLRNEETLCVEFQPTHWDRGVYALLREMSQALDWEWAQHLHGEVLAGPPRN